MHFLVAMASSPWETQPSNGYGSHRLAAEVERKERIEDAWRRHFPLLFRRSLHWTNGRREDAEDALGQAAVVALQKLPENLDDDAALAWLLRLVYSKCMDIHRSHRRRLRIVEDVDIETVPPAATPEADLESSLLSSELARLVRRSIEKMPPRLRSVAEPHLLRDLGYAEIASALDITEVNVRKRMQEARAHLRQRLAAYLEGQAGPPEPQVPKTATPAEEPPRKRIGLSLAALEEYVRRHPRGWKKRQELALRLREAGRLEEAVLHLRLALERQPGQGGLWRELGRILSALGCAGEATATYEEALRRARDLESLEAIRQELRIGKEE